MSWPEAFGLFFAYTKPRPVLEDSAVRVENATHCDTCGEKLRAGDWPFCSGHAPRKQDQSGAPGNVTPIGDKAYRPDEGAVVSGLVLPLTPRTA